MAILDGGRGIGNANFVLLLGANAILKAGLSAICEFGVDSRYGPMKSTRRSNSAA